MNQHTNQAEEQLQMVKDCEARRALLTRWEEEFLQNIRQALSYGRPLSSARDKTLNEIWDRVTEKG